MVGIRWKFSLVAFLVIIGLFTNTVQGSQTVFNHQNKASLIRKVDQKLKVTTFEPVDLVVEENYPSIAMVKPVFTATAYAGYYSCFTSTADDRRCFDQTVVNTWSTSLGATAFINGLISDGYPESRIITITDIDVHEGNIFDENGRPKYNTIVFFHNEYVSLPEYHNMVNFIKAGGNVIILNGNAFFAEVNYDRSTNRLKLVSGHGWNFDGYNGTKADIYRSRFRNGIYNNEHQNWFGSRYTAFSKGSTSGAKFRINTSNPHPIAVEMVKQGISVMSPNYNSHEENSMITQNTHVIADWRTSFKQLDRGIKIYEIFPDGPSGGSLIHFGFFGTDVLGNDLNARKTFIMAAKHQAGYLRNPWIRYPMNGAALKENIILDYTQGWQVNIYIDQLIFPTLSRGSRLDFLDEGTHNLTVVFSKNSTVYTRQVIFDIDRTPPVFLFNNETEFQLPDEYPDIALNITLSDKNADYIRVRIDDQALYYYYKPENQSLPVLTLQLTYPNSKYISLEGIDAAGNSVIQWYVFNSSTTINATRSIQPLLEKINDTTLRISIPKVSENVTARIQISEDFGATWLNYAFTEINDTEDRQYGYYHRNSSSIIYRVALVINGLTTYIRNIKSYQWDNTVYSIQYSNNTAYTKNSLAYTFELLKHQVQNTSVSIQWLNADESLLQNEDFGYSTRQKNEYTTIIPSNSSGRKIIRLKVQSSELNWSREYEINMGIRQSAFFNNTQSLIGTDEILSAIALSNSIFNINTIRIMTTTIDGGTSQIISIYSLRLIQFTLHFNQRVKLEYYDRLGVFIGSIIYTPYPDTMEPIIVAENDVYLNISQIDDFNLTWNIYDDNPGMYSLFMNASRVQQDSFSNYQTVYYSLKGFISGNYNFTLIAEDTWGNWGTHQLVLHILRNTTSTTKISASIQSSSASNQFNTSESTRTTSEDSISATLTSTKSDSIAIGPVLLIFSLITISVLLRINKTKL